MTTIDALLVGQIQSFGARGEASAIDKRVVDGVLAVGWLGLAGDAQADLSVHGGPDKAIHHYPRDHYAWWQTQFGPHPLLERPGAFGENVSTIGLDEQTVCIGDRFRLGTALVEVAQGRQPCWKQAHRLGDKSVVAAMVASQRSGWYYRVLEEGSVRAGDELVQIERDHPAWSVARVTAIVVGGAEREHAVLRELALLASLASGWRQRARRLADALPGT